MRHVRTGAAVTRRASLGLLAGAAAHASAPAWARARRFDALIVGAGLSGLHAARLLEAEGFRVCVVEATDRIGGRILTLDDLPGAPNAGGTQVGGGYAVMRGTARALGVEIAVDRDEAQPSSLFVGDQLIGTAAWAGAAENPFPATLKATTPSAMLFRLAAGDNPLATPQAWRESAARAHDISAADYLASKSLDAAAQRLVDAGLNANSLDTYSMLNVWRTLTLFRADAALGAVGAVLGGSARLTEAMAASIKGEIRRAAPVRSLEVRRDGVEARFASGERVRAPFAICTAPLPSLRRIALDASLPPAQRAAIDTMAYTQIVQIFLEPATPFWERDGLPIDMWTDTPLERVFAVRDRATRAPNGLLLAWLNGDGCAWIDGKSDVEIEAVAGASLQRMRPASEGRVKVRRVVRWTAENPFAGGAYQHWAPGQIAAWADVVGAPCGRLHFAGEHLSRIYTGMEGAFESGEAAARAVIAAAR